LWEGEEGGDTPLLPTSISGHRSSLGTGPESAKATRGGKNWPMGERTVFDFPSKKGEESRVAVKKCSDCRGRRNPGEAGRGARHLRGDNTE